MVEACVQLPNANVKFLGNPGLFQSSVEVKLKFKASC